jgi:threonine dehydratase
VVAATRGNHGLGGAWTGRRLGARLVEEGRDYDESVAEAERLVREEGLHLVHSTNDAAVVEGAGAAGLADLLALREALAGRTVGIVLSGGNIDRETLRRVLTGEI